MFKLFIICSILLIFFLYLNSKYNKYDDQKIVKKDNLFNSNEDRIKYNPTKSNEDRINGSIVFIAGNHGSGTSLMRAILDVKLNCGYETRVMTPILNLIDSLKKNESFTIKTNDYLKVIDKGLSLFLIEIMKKNNDMFDILCAKDPGDIDILYLKQLFPNIRIIYMVRDGRDSAMSNIQREKLPLILSEFYQHVNVWNKVNRNLYDRCTKIGKINCKIVIYEDLVTKPEPMLKDIMNFIGLEFTSEFLRHHELGKNMDKSNNKVKQKINTNRLKTWKNKIKYDFNYMKSNFEMFEKFGFNLEN